VVAGGPCDALRMGIGMTINRRGHPMSGTQHSMKLYNLIWVVVYSFASFPSNRIRCLFRFRPPLLMRDYFGQQCCVKYVSSVSKYSRRLPSLGRIPVERTQMHFQEKLLCVLIQIPTRIMCW